MTDRAAAYADWIKNNQDKLNTPEGRIVVDAYRQLRTAKPQDRQRTSAALSGFNTGLANILGGPVDLLASGMRAVGIPADKPIGGSDSIKGLFEGVGATLPKDAYQPQDRAYFTAGETAGESLPFAAAPYALAARVPAAAKATGMTAPLVNAVRSAPVATAVGEGAAIAGSSAGAFVADKAFPGNPYARMGGEVVGGIAAPLVGAINALSPTLRVIKNFAAQITPDGKNYRAGRAVVRGIEASGEDPERVVSALRSAEPVPAGNMTAGFKSDSPYMITLEKELASRSREYGAQYETLFGRMVDDVNRTITAVASSGDPNAMKQAARMRFEYVSGLAKARIAEAEGRARQTLSRVADADPAARAAANREARVIIEEAVTAARKQEREMWRQVPKDTPVTGEGLRAAIADMDASTLEGRATSYLDGIQRDAIDGVLKGKGTSGQMLQLRSDLLESAREARSGIAPDFKKARILSAMADGILDDLSGLPGSEDARAFSRLLNDTFSRTALADTTGVNAAGRDRVPDDMAIERPLRGQAGGQGARELVEGVDKFLPDRVGAMRDQIGTVVRSDARKMLRPDGTVDPDRLSKFRSERAGIMEQTPSVSDELRQAETAARDVQRATGRQETLTRAMKGRAALSKLIDSDRVDDAVGAALSAPKPLDELRSLAKRANTPEARDGLKSAVFDYLVKRVTTNEGGINVNALASVLDSKMYSGGPSLRSALKATGVVDGAQMRAFDTIVDRATRIQKAAAGKGGVDDIDVPDDALTDVMSKLIAVKAANAGGLTQGLGPGSLVISSAVARAGKNMFVKMPSASVRKIIEQATLDPKLMALLIENAATPRAKAGIERRIRAYLIGAGILNEDEAPE